MDGRHQFEALCRAMADPSFYPHEVTHLERRDTHISVVFLTGKWVYKLKKPLDLGFLNFLELEDRRRFCHAEDTLNRRLSSGVYHGVVSIFRTASGGFSLTQGDSVAEYAVKMKQLPDAVRLKTLLRKGKIRSRHMERLGRVLATFYERSEGGPHVDYYGRRDVVAFNMEENFRQLEPFAGRVFDREKWDFVCQVSRAFLESRANLFDHRVESGRIRDGHGDLRADHVYFYRGIQIIDCIEFNDRFRYGDVVADLSFLHMDMEHLGYADQSRAFLASYVRCGEDPELYALLDFYAAYRAVVRLKISCMRLAELEEEGSDGQREVAHKEAARYLSQAYRYAIQFARPTLWVLCGLPATGKSAAGRMVAEALSIPRFQSDQARKEMQSELYKQARPEPSERVEPFGQGLYRPEMRHLVYGHLLAQAQDALKTGRSVILDATFSSRRWREDALQLAADSDANIVFVECVCSEETLRRRLGEREQAPGLSDARLQHLPDMIRSFEPLEEIPPETHVCVDTEQSMTDEADAILTQAYERQCEQIGKLIPPPS